MMTATYFVCRYLEDDMPADHWKEEVMVHYLDLLGADELPGANTEELVEEFLERYDSPEDDPLDMPVEKFIYTYIANDAYTKDAKFDLVIEYEKLSCGGFAPPATPDPVGEFYANYVE